MSEFEAAKGEIKTHLDSALGGLLPSGGEKEWLEELAADLARERMSFACATSDDQRTRVSKNLEILEATWKIRLAKKQLLTHQTAEKIVRVAIGAVVTAAFPGAGAFAGLAKFAVGAALKGLEGTKGG